MDPAAWKVSIKSAERKLLRHFNLIFFHFFWKNLFAKQIKAESYLYWLMFSFEFVSWIIQEIFKMNWTIFQDQTFLFIYFLSFLEMKIRRKLIWEFLRLFIYSKLFIEISSISNAVVITRRHVKSLVDKSKIRHEAFQLSWLSKNMK